MKSTCQHCGGYLDTDYRCCTCGKWNPPKPEPQITTADNTATCTMGNGWCPLHGKNCPFTIMTCVQSEKCSIISDKLFGVKAALDNIGLLQEQAWGTLYTKDWDHLDLFLAGIVTNACCARDELKLCIQSEEKPAAPTDPPHKESDYYSCRQPEVWVKGSVYGPLQSNGHRYLCPECGDDPCPRSPGNQCSFCQGRGTIPLDDPRVTDNPGLLNSKDT